MTVGTAATYVDIVVVILTVVIVDNAVSVSVSDAVDFGISASHVHSLLLLSSTS